MTAIHIDLDDHLAGFVQTQLDGEHASPADYVLSLIVAERRRVARKDLEAKLLEGLEGPSAALDEAEWESIRREAREMASGNVVPS